MRSEFKLISGKIEKATKGSAAFDLFATCDVRVTDTPVAIPTGVRAKFSPNLVVIIKEKSGLAVKGLEVKAGVIDSDYDLEWKVVMRFPSHLPYHPGDPQSYHIKAGQKIAQVLLLELPQVEFEGDGVVVLDAIRDGGFGSTGK